MLVVEVLRVTRKKAFLIKLKRVFQLRSLSFACKLGDKKSNFETRVILKTQDEHTAAGGHNNDVFVFDSSSAILKMERREDEPKSTAHVQRFFRRADFQAIEACDKLNRCSVAFISSQNSVEFISDISEQVAVRNLSLTEVIKYP